MAIKKLLLLFFLATLTINAQNSNDTLRVLTFNIYGAPESDWPTRISLILDELDTLHADLICLQEIVETPGLQSADNRAKILADSLFERTGMGYNYVWQPTHFSWGVFDEGIAIISPHIILETDFIDLPPGLFTRKALWASVLTPAGIINVYNTHLSYGNQEPVRIQQVAELQNFVIAKSASNSARADILCGDFNATPSEPPMDFLTAADTSAINFLDSWAIINPSDSGFTMPADNPAERIDYVILKDENNTEILDSKLAFVNPNPDDIYPSDHIGVISTIRTRGHPLNLDLQYPQANSIVSGETEISWTLANQTEALSYKIFISNDAGKTWQSLWQGETETSSYTWNTLQNPDGANWLLRIAAVGDSSFALAEVTGTFKVNNPGNAAPELRIIKPRGGENMQGMYNINWEAKDADSDTLSLSIEYSVNDGLTWLNIAQNLENSGSYDWNTTLLSNSSRYRLKVNCRDDSVTVSKTTNRFSIENERIDLPPANIMHVQGQGSGTVTASSFDTELLTGHTYSIAFNDSLPEKTYSVFDNTTAQFIVENATEMDGVTEGPGFDGIRLLIFDYSNAQIDNSNTGWQASNSNLAFSVSLPTLIFGEETLYGFPSPADYRITIADQVMDTSSTYLNANPIPMNFYVENISENYRVDILYLESDSDHSISPLDRIYILEKDEEEQPLLSWQIFFPNNNNPILPLAGDELIISTLKPFNSEDIFEMNASLTTSLKISNNVSKFSFELQQNYPNPFNPSTRIAFSIPNSSHVDIKIYNIAGQLVKKLFNKSLAAGVHTVEWSAAELASGLYFYKIKAGKYSAVKKALVLK